MKKDQRREVYFGLLLFGFALVYLSVIGADYYVCRDQTRDVYTAMNLLKGHWIWFGPLMFTGGHSPGPFYYWLLALPLALTGTWRSTAWLLVALQAAGAVGYWHFGARRFDRKTGLAGYFLYLLSYPLLVNLLGFWNPSYTPFFTILSLILLYEATLARNMLRFVLGSVILGLAMQIHFNQVVILGGALASICIAPRLRSREKLKNLAWMLGSTLLPIVPFMIWKASKNYVERGELPFTFSGVSFLIQTFSSGPHGFGDVCRELLKFEILLLPIAASWVWAVYTQFVQGKPILPRSRFLWSCLLISALPFQMLVYGGNYPRYMVPFFMVLYLISAPVLARFFDRLGWIFTAGLALLGAWSLRGLPLSHLGTLVVFQNGLLLAFAAALLYRVGRGERSFLTGFLFVALCSIQTQFVGAVDHGFMAIPKHRTELDSLLEAVVEKTGWTYSQFADRTYFVGAQPMEDLALPYWDAAHRLPPNPALSGLLIVSRKRAQLFEPVCPASKPNWVRLAPLLPRELYVAAVLGDIHCDQSFSSGPYDICLYSFEPYAERKPWSNMRGT